MPLSSSQLLKIACAFLTLKAKRTISGWKSEVDQTEWLAAMGIRAIFEAIMVKEVGDRGTFKANLKAFVDAGHLAEKYRPLVESVLDAGSAAIHRGYSPPISDVSAMLDLAEGLIASTYIHGPAITRVARRVPPRLLRA